MCQSTRSLLRFADSAEALTSMTLPNVIKPTRPMNIRTIIVTAHTVLVSIVLKPTVVIADME